MSEKEFENMISNEVLRRKRKLESFEGFINEYFKCQYFTYEDYLSLKETIGLANVQEQGNVLTYLRGKLKYVNTAEAILEIVVTEMTNRDSDSANYIVLHMITNY